MVQGYVGMKREGWGGDIGDGGTTFIEGWGGGISVEAWGGLK